MCYNRLVINKKKIRFDSKRFASSLSHKVCVTMKSISCFGYLTVCADLVHVVPCVLFAVGWAVFFAPWVLLNNLHRGRDNA